MSHILNITHVLYLKLVLRQYDTAKKISIALSENKKPPRLGIIGYATYIWAKYLMCGICKTKFRANLDNALVVNFLIHLKTLTERGTFPNYIATSICGFVGGVVVTYFYFIFTTIAVDLSVPIVWYFSVALCIFLTIGLAFFEIVRCIFLSILPEIFTRKVRNILVSYALLLTLTGPGSNILFNSRQLTQTITCTKDQLTQVSHNLTELYMKPLRALKEGITALVNTIRPVINSVKTVLETIKDAINTITNVIRKGLKWLKGLAGLCTNRSGDPRERCLQAISRGIEDCKVSLIPPVNFLCQFNRVVGLTCYKIEFVELICEFKPKLSFTVLDSLEEKLGEVGTFIKTLFYVSVSFHHSFAFETNSTKTIGTVLENAYSAEKNRLKVLFTALNGMKFFLGAYIIFLLISTFVYRQRFLHQLFYDNYVINRFIIELDTKRASAGRQTVFPLTFSERRSYVSLFSLRFTNTERLNILRDTVFLLASVVEVILLFIIDYTLFWVTNLIDRNGRIQFYFGEKESSLQGEGRGFFSYLYKVINNFFSSDQLKFHFDTQPCLPEPLPPAWHIYERVAYIFILSWFTTVFQPFGLRFRNHVMSNYYPEAGRRRAVWLYNKILQSRVNLLLFIRRHLERKSALGIRADTPSFKQWILMRFPKVSIFLPYEKMKTECAVCDYQNPHIKCTTPDCPALYCEDCFNILNNVCLYCNMPQNFHLGDISEEEDSDLDEEPDIDENSKSPWWKFWNYSLTTYQEISLRDIENAYSHDSDAKEKILLCRCSHQDDCRNYFIGNNWRRSDWASIDDYAISLQNQPISTAAKNI